LITLFTTPKHFSGNINTIQLNALRSWRALSHEIQIIIFGDSDGSKKAAEEIQAEYIPNVKCSPQGTPLLSDLFSKADNRAKFPIMTFINADIILPNNFLSVIQITTRSLSKFLMIGHRWDLNVEDLVNFNNKDEKNKFFDLADKKSQKHGPSGIDYFVYNKMLWGKIPDFTVGRPGYDNWLIWQARRSLIPVVDASESVKAIHQNHYYNLQNTIKNSNLGQDYNYHPMLDSIEGKINKKLVEGRFSKKLKVLNILDSTYKISKYKIYKNNDIDSILRFWHKLPTVFPELSFFIKIYRRYLLKYLSNKNNHLLK